MKITSDHEKWISIVHVKKDNSDWKFLFSIIDLKPWVDVPVNSLTLPLFVFNNLKCLTSVRFLDVRWIVDKQSYEAVVIGPTVWIISWWYANIYFIQRKGWTPAYPNSLPIQKIHPNIKTSWYGNVILDISGYQHISGSKIFECPALTMCLHLLKYVPRRLTAVILCCVRNGCILSKYIYLLFLRGVSMTFGSKRILWVVWKIVFPMIKSDNLFASLKPYWYCSRFSIQFDSINHVMFSYKEICT